MLIFFEVFCTLLLAGQIDALDGKILTTTVIEGQRFEEQLTGLSMPLPKDWREVTIAVRQSYGDARTRNLKETDRDRLSVKLSVLSKDPSGEKDLITELNVMSLDLRSSQKVPTAQEFQQHTIERRKRTIPEYRLIAAPSAIKFGEFTFSMYEDSVPSHDAQKPDIQWNCDTVVDGKFLHFYVKGHDREEMQIAIDCVKQLRAAD